MGCPQEGIQIYLPAGNIQKIRQGNPKRFTTAEQLENQPWQQECRCKFSAGV